MRTSVKKHGVQSSQPALVIHDRREKDIIAISGYAVYTIDCRAINKAFFENKVFKVEDYGTFNCYYLDKSWPQPNVQRAGDYAKVNITSEGPGWSFRSWVLIIGSMGLLFYHRNTVYDRLVASL